MGVDEGLKLKSYALSYSSIFCLFSLYQMKLHTDLFIQNSNFLMRVLLYTSILPLRIAKEYAISKVLGSEANVPFLTAWGPASGS